MIKYCSRGIRVRTNCRGMTAHDTRLFPADGFAVRAQPVLMVKVDCGDQCHICIYTINSVQASAQPDFQDGKTNPCMREKTGGREGARNNASQCKITTGTID